MVPLKGVSNNSDEPEISGALVRFRSKLLAHREDTNARLEQMETSLRTTMATLLEDFQASLMEGLNSLVAGRNSTRRAPETAPPDGAVRFGSVTSPVLAHKDASSTHARSEGPPLLQLNSGGNSSARSYSKSNPGVHLPCVGLDSMNMCTDASLGVRNEVMGVKKDKMQAGDVDVGSSVDFVQGRFAGGDYGGVQPLFGQMVAECHALKVFDEMPKSKGLCSVEKSVTRIRDKGGGLAHRPVEHGSGVDYEEEDKNTNGFVQFGTLPTSSSTQPQFMGATEGLAASSSTLARSEGTATRLHFLGGNNIHTLNTAAHTVCVKDGEMPVNSSLVEGLDEDTGAQFDVLERLRRGKHIAGVSMLDYNAAPFSPKQEDMLKFAPKRNDPANGIVLPRHNHVNESVIKCRGSWDKITLEKVNDASLKRNEGYVVFCLYPRCGQAEQEEKGYWMYKYDDSVSLLDHDIKPGPLDLFGLNLGSGNICEPRALRVERTLFQVTNRLKLFNQTPEDNNGYDIHVDDHRCHLHSIFLEPLLAFYLRCIHRHPILGRYEFLTKVSSTVLKVEKYIFGTVVNICTALVFEYGPSGIVEVPEKWSLDAMKMKMEVIIKTIGCTVELELPVFFLERHMQQGEKCWRFHYDQGLISSCIQLNNSLVYGNVEAIVFCCSTLLQWMKLQLYVEVVQKRINHMRHTSLRFKAVVDLPVWTIIEFGIVATLNAWLHGFLMCLLLNIKLEKMSLPLISGYISVGKYSGVLMLWNEVKGSISVDVGKRLKYYHNMVSAFLYAFEGGGRQPPLLLPYVIVFVMGEVFARLKLLPHGRQINQVDIKAFANVISQLHVNEPTVLIRSNGMRVCYKGTNFLDDQIMLAGFPYLGYLKLVASKCSSGGMGPTDSRDIVVYGHTPSVLMDMLAHCGYDELRYSSPSAILAVTTLLGVTLVLSYTVDHVMMALERAHVDICAGEETEKLLTLLLTYEVSDVGREQLNLRDLLMKFWDYHAGVKPKSTHECLSLAWIGYDLAYPCNNVLGNGGELEYKWETKGYGVIIAHTLHLECFRNGGCVAVLGGKSCDTECDMECSNLAPITNESSYFLKHNRSINDHAGREVACKVLFRLLFYRRGAPILVDGKMSQVYNIAAAWKAYLFLGLLTYSDLCLSVVLQDLSYVNLKLEVKFS